MPGDADNWLIMGAFIARGLGRESWLRRAAGMYRVTVGAGDCLRGRVGQYGGREGSPEQPGKFIVKNNGMLCHGNARIWSRGNFVLRKR